MIIDEKHLIEEARKIESESERVDFILRYLYENIQYDYASLLACGYMRETVTDIYPFDPKKDYVPNKYKKGIIISNNNGNQLELDDSFRQTRRVKLGESKLLNRIAELEEQCSGN